MSVLKKQVLTTLKNYPATGHIPEQCFREALAQHTGKNEYLSNYFKKDDEIRDILILLNNENLISLDTVNCERGIGTTGNPKITQHGLAYLKGFTVSSKLKSLFSNQLITTIFGGVIVIAIAKVIWG